MSKFSIIGSLLLSGLGMAHLGATINVSAGVSSSTYANAAGFTTTSFTTSATPAGFTFSGNSGIVNTSVTNVYKSPTGSSYYAYVSPGGSITETLGAAGVGVNYFAIYWGSGDFYNTLTFTDSSGNQYVYGQGGTQIAGVTTGINNPDSLVEFFDTGDRWVSATFTASIPAFEFGEITTGVIPTLATPEPATLTLIGVGLIALRASRSRRRR